MSSAIWRVFRKLCCYIDRKTGDMKSDPHNGEILFNGIQRLISQGEYNGLSTLIRAEGAFVQYNADGSYYRRVGLGITHQEFLIATQVFRSDSDEAADLKIDLAFPLPVLHFFMLDSKAKRFAVCTCVGILMFFEMCEEEPNNVTNWEKWRRVIFLQMGDFIQGSPWQPVWLSPYILNLTEKNDMPAFEFLKTKKGRRLKRKLHFIQHPFTLQLVRSFGVQTDDGRDRSLAKVKDDTSSDRRPFLRSYGKQALSLTKENDFQKNLKRFQDIVSKNQAISIFDTRKLQSSAAPKKIMIPNRYKEAKYKTVGETALKGGGYLTGGENLTGGGNIKTGSRTGRFAGTIPDQRLSMFYGGCRLLHASESLLKSCMVPVRRCCSCDDLHLSRYRQKMETLHDKMVISSWDPVIVAGSLTASEMQIAKKYGKFAKKMQEQTSKRPLEMSSPRFDIDDIDDLVEEFTVKTDSSNLKRSGRDLWMIARRKMLCKTRATLEQFQNIVASYVFKVIPKRYPKLVKHLTELSPLAVSLELFCVSRKLCLAIRAFDVTTFQTSRGKQITSSIRKILLFSEDISKLVISQILSCEDLFDRVDTIKFFIEVCLNLLMKHQDFQSFIAVMHALMSAPIYRLRNTWATFYMQYSFHFCYLICIGKILSQENGFAAYTSRIKMSLNHKNPSIPWIEHFLLHCQMPENKHCRLPHVLKYSYEDGPDLKLRTQSKQMSHRGQSKVFPLAKQSLVDKEKADQPTKSILQQKGWSILANLFKTKKKVRFSSEVEIAERSSSIYDMSQRYKGPLCTSEVDVKDAENREQLELFCQEKATNIIDDVMKDVREHQCEFRKTSKGRGQQTQHQKTSGIYLRRKYIADDENKGTDKEVKNEEKVEFDNQTDTEYTGNIQPTFSKEKKISSVKSDVKNISNTYLEEKKILSTIPEKNIKTSSKHKGEEIPTIKSQRKTNSATDKKRKSSSKIEDKKLPFAKAEKKISALKSEKEKMSTTKKMAKADIKVLLLTTDKDESSTKEGSKVSSDRLAKLYKNSIKLPIGNISDLKGKATDVSKGGTEDMQPPRKRKMSVMEMKKMNRRMSLFEEAEARRDQRKENTVDNEIQKIMADWRRKGSLVEGIEPQIVTHKLKSKNIQNLSNNSENNNKNIETSKKTLNQFHRKHNLNRATFKENMHLQDARNVDSLLGFTLGECTDSDLKLKQRNNSNINDNRNIQAGTTTSDSKSIHPCRSWSGTQIGFDCSALRSKSKCKLCKNGNCIYIHGLWKTLVWFQMNVLKFDVHSSNFVSKCLTALISASARLSESDLLKRSLKIEP